MKLSHGLQNLIIIRLNKRSWTELTFCDMPCTKWIVYDFSFNLHSDIEMEVLLLLLFIDKEA